MTTARRASVFIMYLALSAPAAAQPRVETARAYTDAGLAAERAGDFAAAVRLYRDAYALVPHPMLLFNLGQALRQAGDAEAALDHYQRYLDSDPHEPQREVAIAQIAELRAALTAAARRRASATARAPAPIASDDEDDAPASPRSTGAGRRQRMIGLALGGAGLGSLAVATYFGLRANSLAASLSAPGATYDPAVVDEGLRAETAAVVMATAGGALLVGGAVVYLLGRDAATQRTDVALAPVIGADTLGLAVAGAWP